VAADQAGLIGAALFRHSRRQLLANAAIAASRVASYPSTWNSVA
jgi:hypothetical protein